MKLPVGFSFQEEMAGTWTPPEGGAERPIRFSLHAAAEDFGSYLRDHTVTLSGTLVAEGIAQSASAAGTMLIEPIRKGIIRYELTFTGDDGKPYRLEGHKTVKLLDLPRSMTRLPVSLIRTDSNTEVGRAMLYFDLKGDLLSFLRSWKPLLAH